MNQVISLTLFLVLIFGASISFGYDINTYCEGVADAVGGSYQIEEMCREQEQDAKARIFKMNIPPRIKKYCEEVGQAVGGSYQIMESCIQQELEAKSRMD